MELFTFPTYNDIELEALELLSEEDIKSMIPQVGERVKFLRKWKEHSTSNKFGIFLLHLQEQTHIPSYFDVKKRPQPFILCLYADNKLCPMQSFVIIERNDVPVPFIIIAVDLCYMAHFILDMKYQENCQGVWEFFHTCIYEHI
ncbi:uncharacterized protein [Apostichopus japonicus]|uniref:uncharacterized protein n=1 Tax=Stichopus japonicus TaxID=307972 RepID=UPI003AB658C8